MKNILLAFFILVFIAGCKKEDTGQPITVAFMETYYHNGGAQFISNYTVKVNGNEKFPDVNGFRFGATTGDNMVIVNVPDNLSSDSVVLEVYYNKTQNQIDNGAVPDTSLNLNHPFTWSTTL